MAFIKNLQYKDLTFKLPPYKKVTDEEVEAELERFRLSQSEEVEITDPNYELKNGDIANIYFCGYLNGEKFEGGEADNYDLTIGAHQFIEGFEEKMLGMKIGETKDLDLAFPENYVEHLAGKPVVFKVTVHKIKTKKEVELSDELVKKATKMQSIEEFKAGYRAYASEKYAQEYVSLKNEAILNGLLQNAEVEVTKDMVDAQINTMFSQLEKDLTQYGMTVDQYFEMMGSTKEIEAEGLREKAKENIKKVLIIERVMELENLIASDEEVEEFLKGNTFENIDKEGVKTSLSYTKTLQFLDKNNKWVAE